MSPILGGELIRERFHQRSWLVTADESSHGAYVYSDNACLDAIASEFLLEGISPKRDTA